MDIDYVREKLFEKKRLDPDFLAHGSMSHKYILHPPIEDEALSNLEKQFQISLPDEIRKFFTTVANGGAGPGYGLYSIEGALTGNDPNYDFGGRKTGAITQDFIRPNLVPPDELADDCGILLLCQHGCANDDYIVINGNERGTVWGYIEWVGHMVPLVNDMPNLSYINGLPKDEKRKAESQWVSKLLTTKNEEIMSFSEWYIAWLEKPPYIPPAVQKRHNEKSRWFSQLW